MPSGGAIDGRAILHDALLCQKAPHRPDVDVAVLVAVDEDRPGADVAHRVDRGDEGDGRHDDLVVGLDAAQFEADVQRRGAAVAGHRVLHPHVLGQGFLEAHHVLAGRGYPAGLDAVGHVFELPPEDRRFAQGDHRVTLYELRVLGRIGIGDQALPYGLGHLADAVGQAHAGGEAQGLDAREVDLVVAGVFDLLHVVDFQGHLRRDLLGDHLLGVVLGVAAHVESLARDQLDVAFEHQVDRPRDVSHVAVGAPEVLAVDLQLAFDHGIAGELVDGEVEARSQGQPVDGGKAQDGERHGRGPPEEVLLDPHLELGVQAHGTKRRLLVEHGVSLHLAVVAARGSEDEVLRSMLLAQLEQVAGAVPDGPGSEVGSGFAGRVAHDRSQVDDGVETEARWAVVFEEALQLTRLGDVGLREGETGQRQQIDERLAAEEQSVGHDHPAALREQVAGEHGPHVSGAACYEHSLHSSILYRRTPQMTMPSGVISARESSCRTSSISSSVSRPSILARTTASTERARINESEAISIGGESTIT